MTNNETFSRFGKGFQENVVHLLLLDRAFADQFGELLEYSFFEYEYLRTFIHLIFDYRHKYKTHPTYKIIEVLLRTELDKEIELVQEQVRGFYAKIKLSVEIEGAEYTKEKAIDFAKGQKLKAAILQSVPLIEEANEASYDKIKKIVNDALKLGVDNNLGQDLIIDFEKRYEDKMRKEIPTGWEEVDKITQGGLGKGEMGVVISTSGGGKCQFYDTNVDIKWNNTNKLETIQIGELFKKLDIKIEEDNTIKNDFVDISVRTLNGYRKIEAFYNSPKLASREIFLENGMSLRGSYEHRVMCKLKINLRKGLVAKDQGGYVHVRAEDLTMEDIACSETLTTYNYVHMKNLSVGSLVETISGLSRIKEIKDHEEEHILYDFQVEEVHCLYTNGILSHNSMAMVHLAATALQDGKNVIYYTLELSEEVVDLRFDSFFSGVPLNDLKTFKDLVFEEVKKKYKGKLLTKYYPPMSATLNTLRNHLEKVKQRGVKIDLIIVDYADRIKPMGNRNGGEKRHELEEIYEELRGIAGENECTLYTCSQTNRGGLNAEVITMDSISEAYNKCFPADLIVTISRTIEDRASNSGKMFIAKNRFGVDSIVYDMEIDTSLVKLKVLDKIDKSIKDINKKSEEEEKVALLEKYRKFKEGRAKNGS